MSRMLVTEKVPPGYVEHEVQHYRQCYNWDCGLACVLMVLSKEKHEEFLKNFDMVCQEEGFGQSTWTIDLSYLLKRYGIRHCMYTTLLGVNDDYHRVNYYNRIINKDKVRVQKKFDEASSMGVEVIEGMLNTEQLVTHLSQHGPVIVLVDAGLLVCDLCKHNKLKAEFRRCFGGGYTGHYILLVGYSSRTGKLVYRDPSLPARLCAVSFSRLADARSASGTDEDAILIFNNFR